MGSTFNVKWSIESEQQRFEPFATNQEALSRVSELFRAHGDKLYVEIYQDDSRRPYLDFRRLSQRRRSLITI